LEVREYLKLLRRWWWLITILVLIGSALGYFLTPNPVPIYASSVKLLLNQGETSASSVRNAQAFVSTYSELMRSRSLMLKVSSNLTLNESPESLANRITVSSITGTSIMQLRVVDTNPQRAADIANEVVRVFLEENGAQQTLLMRLFAYSLKRMLFIRLSVMRHQNKIFKMNCNKFK
jgi:capsular polysaccharide biosynthesis protein